MRGGAVRLHNVNATPMIDLPFCDLSQSESDNLPKVKGNHTKGNIQSHKQYQAQCQTVILPDWESPKNDTNIPNHI